MTQAEIKKKFDTSQRLALARVERMAQNGTIECEYSDCKCPFRNRIGPSTVSVIVTPDYEVELVCAPAALDFAHKHNIDPRSV
ncbi:hypothetical protein [Spirosoma sordidisoli]|uniref:Uncharacterized protein n=1 Tax=Spirosoma sordidisoli TaxID=2502893 RepID=A0A4Q2USG2_9BACT|nr:hypothetical protein [Spirosoma sordidisoli]RYC69769.1 hypothetical protein EQG79_14330 [Spirosoma sordidisoli]